MMYHICGHDARAEECDDCYDDARAASELSDGYYVPSVAKSCFEHPHCRLDANSDCKDCMSRQEQLWR